MDAAIAAAGPQLRLHGPYQPADLPQHLGAIDWVIVPSIWWENAPLVILEALLNARPVICSGIGGMAELVDDGQTGLHFRAGDAGSLMHTMRRAIDESGLWDRLATGLSVDARAAMTIKAAAERHLASYERLLAA